MVQDCSLEDDHGSPLHCCIVLFLPVTQVTQVTNETGVLKLAFLASLATLWGGCCPPCLLSGEDWENDTSLYVSPKKGDQCENHEKPPLERCSQTLVWGKQSVRLSAAASPTLKGEPGGSPDPL